MRVLILFLALLAFLHSPPVAAHFLVLLPSDDIVEGGEERTITLDIEFTHPMAWGPAMDMARPERFGVLVNGRRLELRELLKPRNLEGHQAFQAIYRIESPGDHLFFLEPAPYWEKSENRMIIHYAKVVVNGFGAENGWDATVGLPVEIIPLTRPYGLWTGNLFSGRVLRDGKPVPFATVEVEYYNEGGKVTIPAGPYTTQTLKTDGQGVFSYAMPRAGWWGFAALVDGKETMKNPQGEETDVELGGLLWVRTRDMR